MTNLKTRPNQTTGVTFSPVSSQRIASRSTSGLYLSEKRFCSYRLWMTPRTFSHQADADLKTKTSNWKHFSFLLFFGTLWYGKKQQLKSTQNRWPITSLKVFNFAKPAISHGVSFKFMCKPTLNWTLLDQAQFTAWVELQMTSSGGLNFSLVYV